MSNLLFDAYFTSAAMRAVFCDHGRLQGMLDFEAALARAEAAVGVIPQTAVAPIAAACRAELYDAAELARAVVSAGNSAIPLVKALGRQIAAQDPEAERLGGSGELEGCGERAARERDLVPVRLEGVGRVLEDV